MLLQCLFKYHREHISFMDVKSSKPNNLMHFEMSTKWEPVDKLAKLASQPASEPVSQLLNRLSILHVQFFFRYKYSSSSFQFYFPLSFFFSLSLLNIRCRGRCHTNRLSLKKIICLRLTSMKNHIKYCNTRRHVRNEWIQRQYARGRKRLAETEKKKRKKDVCT